MANAKSGRAKVTGVGGVFLRSASPARLASWYRKHLGLAVPAKGQMVVWDWRSRRDPAHFGSTLWAALGTKDKDWGTGNPTIQVNLRVDNLDRLVAQLRKAKLRVGDPVDYPGFGRFSWVDDPEGNRVELWEPPTGKRSTKGHASME